MLILFLLLRIRFCNGESTVSSCFGKAYQNVCVVVVTFIIDVGIVFVLFVYHIVIVSISLLLAEGCRETHCFIVCYCLFCFSSDQSFLCLIHVFLLLLTFQLLY